MYMLSDRVQSLTFKNVFCFH